MFSTIRNKNEWTDHQLLIPFKMSSTNELNIQYIDVDRPTVAEKGFGYDQNLFLIVLIGLRFKDFFRQKNISKI